MGHRLRNVRLVLMHRAAPWRSGRRPQLLGVRPPPGRPGTSWRLTAIVREFDDPGIGVMDELSLLLRALLAAGRADAATAAALVVYGHGADAVAVVTRSMSGTRDTYHELYRTIPAAGPLRARPG